MRFPLLAAALSFAALAPLAAHADVPPPPDYKDPCLAEKIGPEEDCRECRAPEFKDKACHDGALRDGYTQRCRGWNYAMYCRGAAPGPSAAASGSPTAAPGPSAVASSGPTAAPAASSPASNPPRLAPDRGHCACKLGGAAP
ncbi:MAG: hypothetical protein IT373_02810, partial [Polyangiaceae bacterium]|nr:hypothetical protein [Polyangiaceae bacterium]